MFLSRSLAYSRFSVRRLAGQVVYFSVDRVTQAAFETFAPQYTEINHKFLYDGQLIAMKKDQKRAWEKQASKKRKLKLSTKFRGSNDHSIEGTNEEILELEAEELLAQADKTSRKSDNVKIDGGETPGLDQAAEGEEECDVELFKPLTVSILQLSSTGDGLALSPDGAQIIVVPFTVPGDQVLAKPYKNLGTYVHADMVKVIKPSVQREGTTPGCKYFAECSGCQLQMISYDDQLAHKKHVVQKAFQRFSNLAPEKIPEVRQTMGSPLQYGYRTKLTPHFSVPRSAARKGGLDHVPPIGFNKKGQPSVMDIEHCPIGTPILQEGLRLERAKVAVNIKKYRNGATILLRESTARTLSTGSSSDIDFDPAPTSTDLSRLDSGAPQLIQQYPTYTDVKTYTSQETGFVNEYIGRYKFENRAGSFFQNNNSILPSFTKYVYDNCMLPTALSETGAPKIKYLLDAYCGSGLFTITLSPLFSSALGIDIDPRGIEAARLNAEANHIPNAGFIAADATDLFGDVPYPPDESLVIIDPPRKGASKDFLHQLCRFGAKRVIYVSCNVHTQARDVGMIVNGFKELEPDQNQEGTSRYEIESLRGFDFFPQTGHVEGVCVLNRVDTRVEA